ncbi:hypothetical protein DFH27DRAFT_620186 [Peziza echinospora]|nr:hypothetical protein DFH27DRAFT_620186 [Peziza echinospora]
MAGLKRIWQSYTPIERKNIMLYILGLMLYKFSFEIWTGALTTISLTRFHPQTDEDGDDEGEGEGSPVGILGVLQALNLLSQCVGTAFVSWGLRRGWSTRRILVCAVLCGVVVSAGLLGLDAGTGGRWREDGGGGRGRERYGEWDPRILFVVFCVAGGVAGCVEVVRKVVPREVLGGSFMDGDCESGHGRGKVGGGGGGDGDVDGDGVDNNNNDDENASEGPQHPPYKNGKAMELVGDKLRRMDAAVHIFYELAGTCAAFLGAELSLRWGSNYSVGIVPLGWLLACLVWLGVRVDVGDGDGDGEGEGVELQMENSSPSPTGVKDGPDVNVDAVPVVVGGPPAVTVEVGKRGRVRNGVLGIGRGIKEFLSTLRHGSKLILSTPKYAWLLLGYSLSLYSHRYLENGLAPAVAKYVYNEPAFYQIIVGGSNLGELLGALAVFLLADVIKSPIPWMRLDALALLGVWAVSAWRPPLDESTGKVDAQWAWKLAVVFLPISFGWAAGDVSLMAYIQANLGQREDGQVQQAQACNGDGDGEGAGIDVGNEGGRRGRGRIKSRKEVNQDGIASLGAIMAVLYSTYIALFALLNPLLGIYLDKVVNRNERERGKEGWDSRGGIWRGLQCVGGAQFTVMCVLVGGGTWLAGVERWPRLTWRWRWRFWR